jgi:hypothetical protein
MILLGKEDAFYNLARLYTTQTKLPLVVDTTSVKNVFGMPVCGRNHADRARKATKYHCLLILQAHHSLWHATDATRTIISRLDTFSIPQLENCRLSMNMALCMQTKDTIVQLIVQGATGITLSHAFHVEEETTARSPRAVEGLGLRQAAEDAISHWPFVVRDEQD